MGRRGRWRISSTIAPFAIKSTSVATKSAVVTFQGTNVAFQGTGVAS